MKPSEEYAARMLYEFLGRQGVDCRCAAGGNPPDYVFEVGTERWGVEVTELHDYVELDGAQSALWVEKGLQKVFDDINRETASSRKRRYTISLSGPIKSQDVGTIKRQAIEHILDKIIPKNLYAVRSTSAELLRTMSREQFLLPSFLLMVGHRFQQAQKFMQISKRQLTTRS